MIFSKKDIQEVLPADVTGRSVAHPKRWLVALVRISHEKKTSERLSKMGIENFLPVQQEVHQWSDRRKVVERVLLPMMIFVHVDMYEQKEVFDIGLYQPIYGIAWRKYSCCHSGWTDAPL